MIKLFSLFSLLLVASISYCQDNRSLSGEGNNITNSEWGSVNTPLLRYSTTNYIDSVQGINNEGLPLPRKVSNDLFSQKESFQNDNNLSDFVWLFGQFLDHDISKVETDPNQSSLLEMPEDELFFDEDSKVFLSRSKQIDTTGIGNIPREYANQVTSFIDASMVYGSDLERANWLRSFVDGKMKVSKSEGLSVEGDLLPWNTTTNEFNGSANIDYSAPHMDNDKSTIVGKHFVCGDTRANESPLLISMHTLFVREHNRICDETKNNNPSWEDEQIYQRARKCIGAYIQSIAYNEWLPSIGVAIPEYSGYYPELQSIVFNEFSAAAFRIGHTMIGSDIIIMDDNGEISEEKSTTLAECYFEPRSVLNNKGIDAYFKGMGTQVMQEMDCKMVDDLRNFLFVEGDGSAGFDLASINIFRGRDRGLPDYNTMRQDFGLAPLTAFDQLTESEDIETIKALYNDDLNKIDAWVGLLSEKHISSDALFGELTKTIIEEQFSLLRDADRFYYMNDPAFTDEQKEKITSTTLHDIIMRNTSISLMQPNVFQAMPHSDIPVVEIDQINLNTLVYPNPVIDEATVKIYSDTAQQDITYKLFDLYGKVLNQGSIEDVVEGGENYLFLDFGPTISKGMYTLVIETSTAYKTIQIIK